MSPCCSTRLLLTRLRRAKAPELASLMVTLGATLFLYSAATAIFGTDIRRFPPAVFEGGAFEIAGVRLTLSQILIVGTAAALGRGSAVRHARNPDRARHPRARRE